MASYEGLSEGGLMKAVDLTNSLWRHPFKKYNKRKLSQIDKIVVHCTDRDWTIIQLNHYDVDGFLKYEDGTIEINHVSASGLPAITYHDVILMDGKLYHTLPYEEVSWHAGGYNTGSIAVALMYRVTDSKTNEDTFAPTSMSLQTLQTYLGKLCLQLGLTPDRVMGHRELFGTGWFHNSQGSKRLRKTCPGLKVDLDLLRINVATYMQLVLKMKGFYSGEIDGDFGPKSKAAMKLFTNNEI